MNEPMAKRVPVVRPRVERTDDVQLPIPSLPRDVPMLAASIGIGLVLAAFVTLLIVAVVTAH